MKSPKPAPKGQPQLNTAELTTRGTPRKRAPGAGRPALTDPRSRTLPRVSELTHAILSAYAAKHDCYLADAIEAAALALETTQRTARRTKPTGHQVSA
jgi:hypothetical protein